MHYEDAFDTKCSETMRRLAFLWAMLGTGWSDEGRSDGWEEQQNRVNETYERFGIKVVGVLTRP